VGWTYTGRVDGLVRFPDHPDHEGAWGLQGGEDVQASRSSFRSIGEAMTWCRKVLDGEIAPRWEPVGKLLEPYTGPQWSSARVTASTPWYDADDLVYETDVGDRQWHEAREGHHRGNVARTDP
jgi:hypothetical protein